ncbi:MAG: hypothetical protein ACFCVG_16055, partial [Kineosporiaceae bacterium]
ERAGAVLGGCVADVTAGLPPGTLPDVHAPFDARPGSLERTAVAERGGAGTTLDVTGTLGDTGAVSALFQLSGVVPVLSGAGGHALVTSVDAEGVVGAALVRVPAAGAGA